MKTFVIGHKKPDTDSVTSAISLSYLKNALGDDTEPRILSEINQETEFVLNYFHMPIPKILDDVKVQIKDVSYGKDVMVEENASIYEAYTFMVDNGYTGLPVVGEKKKFVGYVSLREIATDFIRGEFDHLNSSYKNIQKILNAKEILKFDDEIQGNIIAATFGSETFISKAKIDRDTIVIVGSRKYVLDYCISKSARMIILVGDQSLTEGEMKEAKKNKVNIVVTSKESFEVSKLIGLSNYIKNILRSELPTTFDLNDYVTDFLEVSNREKHTNYSIVDKRGRCNGMLRVIDVNTYNKKQVILVDHNEVKQSVEGINEATILEVIDHHALGNLTTNVPISFRNMILGSTNSIIYFLYKEAGIKIPKNIAGIMLAGLLSDTLILKSPTTTPTDKMIAEELSKIAKLDIETFGMEMLRAGSSFKNKTVEEVVTYDSKEFEIDGKTFGISQILTLEYEDILKRKEDFINYLNKISTIKGYKVFALYITDIISNGSYVLYSDNSEKILSLAHKAENLFEGYYLSGIVSRKKQIVPNIINEIENNE